MRAHLRAGAEEASSLLRVSPWKRRTMRPRNRGATGGRAASATAWIPPRAPHPPPPCSSTSTSTGRGRRSAGSRPGRWRRATSSSTASSGPSRRGTTSITIAATRGDAPSRTSSRMSRTIKACRSTRASSCGSPGAPSRPATFAPRATRTRPTLTISAVDDTGTSVTVRLPPSAARHPALRTGSGHLSPAPSTCATGSAPPPPPSATARGRAATADAAFAKMRRGAEALREAVRIYDASFEQTSAAGGIGSSVRPRTGLAGISPVKTAPPPGGRRWRTDALAIADEMDAAVRDADAHAAGTVEWTAIEANERGRGGGGAGVRPSGEASAGMSGNEPRRGPSAGCNSRRTSRGTRAPRSHGGDLAIVAKKPKSSHRLRTRQS